VMTQAVPPSNISTNMARGTERTPTATDGLDSDDGHGARRRRGGLCWGRARHSRASATSTITVTGSGTVQGTPDTINFQIGVSTVNRPRRLR